MTIKVRNQDIPQLACVLPIMQEVVGTERKAEWMRERMYGMGQHLTGMPGGGSLPKGLDDPLAEISELCEKYKEQMAQCTAELKEAENILNGIKSRTMRTFVLMKYVLDVPNTKIMKTLGMSKWHFERALKTIEDAPDMAHAAWHERYETI